MIRKVISKIYWMSTVIMNSVINKIPSRKIRKFFLRLLGCHIGKKSVVFRGVEILKPCELRIGERSSIGWHSFIDARGKISIGNNVTVASFSKLITAKHDINDPMFHAIAEPIVVEDYAWICTGVSICGGGDNRQRSGCCYGSGCNT